MDLEKMKLEVTTDPLGVGYAGMTRDQIWASLNTVNRNKRQVVDAKRFAKWAATGGRLEAINNAQTTGATNAIKSASRYLILLITGWQGIDPDDSDDVASVNALVAAGVINPGDRTTLSNLANKPVSRLEEINNLDMPRNYFNYLLDQYGV